MEQNAEIVVVIVFADQFQSAKQGQISAEKIHEIDQQLGKLRPQRTYGQCMEESVVEEKLLPPLYLGKQYLLYGRDYVNEDETSVSESVTNPMFDSPTLIPASAAIK